MKNSLACILVLLLIPITYGAAGNLCNATSPCLCGTSCQGGGYEIANDFNTIDGHLITGCQDGADDNYEYTQEINVTDLERDTFTGGDLVKVTATALCDGSGDYVSASYFNGTRWSIIDYYFCENTGFTDIPFTFHLDDVVANHTVRVSTYWAENTNEICVSSQTCGHDCEPVYADTDDVSFAVEERELVRPSVSLISPLPGTEYAYETGLFISISANVTDGNGIRDVQARIDWEEGPSYEDMMGVGDIYAANFSVPAYVGEFNVTILASDTFGNINDSQTTDFSITRPINITIFSPMSYYTDGKDIPLSFEVHDTYDIERVGVLFNGNDIGSDFAIGPRNNATATSQINNSLNISQPINISQDMKVRRVHIFGSGGTAEVMLRETIDGPDIASANISFTSGWATALFQDTLSLSAGTYWLVIAQGNVELGTNTNYTDLLYNGTAINESLLFKVPDEHMFHTLIQGVQGQNNLTIEKNNSIGISQSLDVSFVVDGVVPQMDSLEYEDVVERGYRQHFMVAAQDVHSSVDQVSILLNSTTLEMDVNGSAWNLSVTMAQTGAYTFRVRLNDSAGNLDEIGPYTFDVIDTLPPQIIVQTDPQDDAGLDPNITVHMHVNATDHSVIDELTLLYRQTESWTSVPVSASYANFTPPYPGLWQYRIYANDSESNSVLTDITTLNVSFDETWVVSPSNMSLVSAPLGQTTTLANITIHNTGDFSRRFEMSTTGTPAIDVASALDLDSGQEKVILVNVTAPVVASQYPYSIIITNLNTSLQKQIQGTLIVYESGPYLFLEFDIFDAIVQKDDHVMVSLKITNMGNETSTDTRATWTFSKGISTRTPSNHSLGDIAVGQTIHQNISYDVTQSSGQISVSVDLTNDENKSASLTRTVSITAPAVITKSTSSSGYISSGFIMAPSSVKGINVSIETIEVDRGKPSAFSMKLSNTGSVSLHNVFLSIPDLYEKYYSFSVNDTTLLPDQTRVVHGTLSLPLYFETGPHDAVVEISADDFIESVTLPILVHDSKPYLEGCIQDVGENISRVQEQGIPTQTLRAAFDALESAYAQREYGRATDLCLSIEETILLAYAVRDRIDGVDAKSANVAQALEVVRDLYVRGEFEKADQRLDQVDLLATAAPRPFKETLHSFIRRHKDTVLAGLAASVVLGLLVYKGAASYKRRHSLEFLQQKKKTILSLMKQLQEDYYVNKVMPETLYSHSIEQYIFALGHVQLATLDHVPLERRQQKVKEMIEELQMHYFENRLVTKPTYERMLALFEEEMAK